ncbi:MAG: serine/threonine-protein kinase [Rubripirellula sp.]|nr:serine/threonine-protein kinase [Rubripirellula sp.]
MNRSPSNFNPDPSDGGIPQDSSAASGDSNDPTRSVVTHGPDDQTLEIPLSSGAAAQQNSAGSQSPPPESLPTDATTGVQKLDATLAEDETDKKQINGDFSDAETPSTLGRYRIETLLGRGGMGSVYRAHDTQLDRKVALKVPKFESNAKSRLVERFYREARSAANLAHPNLCPVFDVGEVDGTHYIAMALIKGDTLSSHINGQEQLSERFAAVTVFKVARAMQEAHGSGIIHRDLKPANIMIDHRKEPIVMDFGLACPDDLGDDSRLTQEGALLGSPAYMSPEQLRGATDSIGQGSDVYALGVVLYEILSGRLPYEGNGSTVAMIGQILTEQPTDLKSLRPTISSVLAKICAKAMAKDTAERYSSMESFGNDLERFLRSTSSRTKSSGDATRTVQANVTRIQLNEQTKLAKTLCDSKQFIAAAPILQQILDNPHAKNSKTQQWAATTLTKVQARIAEDNRDTKSDLQKANQSADFDNNLFADLPDATAVAGPLAAQAFAIPARPVANKPGHINPKIRGMIASAVACLILIGGAVWFFSQPPTPPAASPATTSPPTATAIAANVPPDTAADSGSTDIERRREPPGTRPGTRPGGLGQNRRPSLTDRFLQKFDNNNNGMIEPSELPKQENSKIMRADTNSDGRLTRIELQNSDPRDLLPLVNFPRGNENNRSDFLKGGPNGRGFNNPGSRGDTGSNGPPNLNGRPRNLPGGPSGENQNPN